MRWVRGKSEVGEGKNEVDEVENGWVRGESEVGERKSEVGEGRE